MFARLIGVGFGLAVALLLFSSTALGHGYGQYGQTRAGRYCSSAYQSYHPTSYCSVHRYGYGYRNYRYRNYGYGSYGYRNRCGCSSTSSYGSRYGSSYGYRSNYGSSYGSSSSSGYGSSSSSGYGYGSRPSLLTNSAGLTLYYFTADTATRSACTGACTRIWPPLRAGSSVYTNGFLPGRFGVVDAGNGPQVTYNGHLLYTYYHDYKPGDTNGQGLMGKWFYATPGLYPQSVYGSSAGYNY